MNAPAVAWRLWAILGCAAPWELCLFRAEQGYRSVIWVPLLIQPKVLHATIDKWTLLAPKLAAGRGMPTRQGPETHY